ncbi:hypothetical protein LPN01_17860 [Sphingomonas sp. A2-49]|uniref:CC_3452 family protein n=1 Tax=Sphingomonas sp. A2-49 TaxID=1391375 RepID=UPI0021CEBC1A|nr:hypothetical protein [Sphingomonas sp. A2-49]MCU6455947.1 hypothetical protein [Sphingomonas sp. A2-49]
MKLIAPFALAAAILTGGAATAAPGADVYAAVPAAPTAKTNFITRSTAWRLQNGTFVAGQAPERPAVLCELVVRQVGALTSFTVAGKAYDADQLARCNAKAKKA